MVLQEDELRQMGCRRAGGVGPQAASTATGGIMRGRWLYCLCLATLLAAGCVAPPTADPELLSDTRPVVSLGGEVLLAEGPVGGLKAVADPGGAVHILLQPKAAGPVRHLVYHDGRTEERLPLPALAGHDEALDAVFDAHGVLHVIAGKRHLALDAAGWAEIEGPGCRRFVPGGSNVICLFRLAPADPRNKTRWDWFGFGGFGVGIIWPWRETAIKYGLAEYTENGWTERGIVDCGTDMDLVHADAVADPAGDIDIVFRRQQIMFTDLSQLRYERFNALDKEAAPIPPESVGRLGPEDTSWSLLGVTRDEFNRLAEAVGVDRHWRDPLIALDPGAQGSLVLMVDSLGKLWARSITGGQPRPARVLLDEKGHRHVRGMVTLPDGRVVALLEESRVGWWTVPPQPLRIIEYQAGRWSAPVEIGTTKSGEEVALIASDSHRLTVIGHDPAGRPYLMIAELGSDGRR